MILMALMLGCFSCSKSAETTNSLDLGPLLQDAESGLSYYLVTTGEGDSNEPLPWIIALHGVAATAESFAELFQEVPYKSHVYVVQAPNEFHRGGYDWFGSPPGGDNVEYGAGVLRAAQLIRKFSNALVGNERNLDKPVITGFSQGGILSLAMATYYPQDIRASVPVSGWLPSSIWPETDVAPIVPVIAFHGEKDSVLPISATEESIIALRSLGMEIEFQRYSGLDHQISRKEKQDWSQTIKKLIE